MCAKILIRRVAYCSFAVIATASSVVYARQHPVPLPVPKGDAVDLPYWGEVAELKKDSVTIRFPNPKIEAKTFALSAGLMAGNVPSRPRVLPGTRSYQVRPSFMYRIVDVRVGDLVTINYAQVEGRSICDHICIQKRPGGRVPPLPEEAENLRHPPPVPPGFTPPVYTPYHEVMNAYWDRLERTRPAQTLPAAPPPREVSRSPAL